MRVSKYRPRTPILAITPNESTQRQLSLSWGVTALKVTEAKTIINMFSEAATAVSKWGLCQEGDLVVVTAGLPMGKPGGTNMLKVERI
jgi:pyruvate kinase